MIATTARFAGGYKSLHPLSIPTILADRRQMAYEVRITPDQFEKSATITIDDGSEKINE
jgi:hypothetical protein